MRSMFLMSLLATVILASEAEIRSAEAAFAKAIQAKDIATLDKLFLPKIIYAHATGKIETKKEYLDRLSGGKQVYKSYTI